MGPSIICALRTPRAERGGKGLAGLAGPGGPFPQLRLGNWDLAALQQPDLFWTLLTQTDFVSVLRGAGARDKLLKITTMAFHRSRLLQQQILHQHSEKVVSIR